MLNYLWKDFQTFLLSFLFYFLCKLESIFFFLIFRSLTSKEQFCPLSFMMLQHSLPLNIRWQQKVQGIWLLTRKIIFLTLSFQHFFHSNLLLAVCTKNSGGKNSIWNLECTGQIFWIITLCTRYMQPPYSRDENIFNL